MRPVKIITAFLLVEPMLAFVAPQIRRINSFKSHQPSTSTYGWNRGKQQQKVKASTRISQSLLNVASYDEECDVLVLGSGPAGRAIASLLSSSKVNLSVSLADTNFGKEWAPNYGVWTNEWDAILEAYQNFGISLNGGSEGGCIDKEWLITDCYFGGSFDIPTTQRMRLDRPYKRVDKNALRDCLSNGSYKVLDAKHISQAINVNMYSPPGSLVHDEAGTTIQLEQPNGDKMTVRTKLLIDTTGHETKLVLRDTREPYSAPGFQIAYGCLVEVDESDSPDKTHIGPYDKEAMTLFDYRTDHFDDKGEITMTKAEKSPTFSKFTPRIKTRAMHFVLTMLQ